MAKDNSAKFRYKQVESETFSKTSVDLLGLSNRAVNALKSNKLYTVGDITDHWWDLLVMPRIGVTVAQEIRAAVFAAYLNDIWNDDRKLEILSESLEAV